LPRSCPGVAVELVEDRVHRGLVTAEPDRETFIDDGDVLEIRRRAIGPRSGAAMTRRPGAGSTGAAGRPSRMVGRVGIVATAR
jgi:hypothetical protein